MKKMNVYTNVCIMNTVYSYFIYLLITEEKDIEKTFFFCSEKFPLSIRTKLNHYCFPLASRNRFVQVFRRILIKYLSDFIWPFLNKASIYGGDNYYFCSGLIKNNSITLIEDGLWNYAEHNEKVRFRYLRKLLFGSIDSQGAWGRSDNVKKIILTGLKDIPCSIKDKAVIVNINELWKQSISEKKNLILKNFDCSYSEIKYISNYKIIVLTQPLSEDSLISEEEKLELYRKLLQNVLGKERILFKLHPRDKTDYKRHFSNIDVFSKPIPMEILSLLGIRFEQVYTIFSTAAKNLPYNAQIHFLGTSSHPTLLKIYGDIK